MSKEETAIREEFRKAVIMGNHPECKTYEAALRKELKIRGCVIGIVCDTCIEYSTVIGEDKHGDLRILSEAGNMLGYKIDGAYQIIGLPITIGRVMYALKGKRKRICVSCDGVVFTQNETMGLATWLLTKDGREAVDTDQLIGEIKKMLAIMKA